MIIEEANSTAENSFTSWKLITAKSEVDYSISGTFQERLHYRESLSQTER